MSERRLAKKSDIELTAILANARNSSLKPLSMKDLGSDLVRAKERRRTKEWSEALELAQAPKKSLG